MKTYIIRTWAGREEIVEADRLSFEPAHVAFWASDGRLILAEGNGNVTKIEEIGEPKVLGA